MLFYADNLPPRFPSRLPRARKPGFFSRTVLCTAFVCACMGIGDPGNCSRAQTAAAATEPNGANPHPVQLLLPPEKPLSAAAQLGKLLFFDRALSASGKQSCASCHSPRHAYNPPNRLTVQPGGRDLASHGERPAPSLAYLYQQAPFSIGPDTGPDEVAVTSRTNATSPLNHSTQGRHAGTPAKKASIVPQGGLFWDGRADSLQKQALVPLLDPQEMANTNIAEIANKLAHAGYQTRFMSSFGPDIFKHPDLLVFAAMYAIARYQIEDSSFHAFSSKYDAWLQGHARLSATEQRGMQLFNDPDKGNCAACHLSQVAPDGSPPLFTDGQYEALGAPRNPQLPHNSDPHFYDLGLCGPIRKDLAEQTQYCGMFLTPTLRNVDRREVFFHNGVYCSLKQVLDFYNLRSVDPGKIYPHDASGKVALYNDIPAAFHQNVDKIDAPFNLEVGDPPPLTDLNIQDIIAFIHTLDDGYMSNQHPLEPAPGQQSIACSQR